MQRVDTPKAFLFSMVFAILLVSPASTWAETSEPRSAETVVQQAALEQRTSELRDAKLDRSMISELLKELASRLGVDSDGFAKDETPDSTP